MISIGNDIIALNHTNPERTIQKKFYSKIICKEEVELFNQVDLKISFENFIWLAWSIKESVYKFYKRHYHQSVIVPTKIVIKKIQEPVSTANINFTQHENISFNSQECFCCGVIFNDNIFYSRSFINNNCIFTVVNNKDCFSDIFWGVQQINDNSYSSQSDLVRKFVLNRLKEQFSNNDFDIQKAIAGYPYLKNSQEFILSFTHHGNFIGYSFLVNK